MAKKPSKEDIRQDRRIHAIDRLIDVLEVIAKEHKVRSIQYSNSGVERLREHLAGVEWEKYNTITYDVIPRVEKLKESM